MTKLGSGGRRTWVTPALSFVVLGGLLAACGNGGTGPDGALPDGVSSDGAVRDALPSETTPPPDGTLPDGIETPDEGPVEMDALPPFDAPDAMEAPDSVAPDGDTASPDGATEDTPVVLPDGAVSDSVDVPPAGDTGPCISGQTLCGTSCVDTRGDREHCGACGMACPAGLACVMGACACPTGTTRCGTDCVDTQSAAMNCGSCGTTCPTGQSCAAGACACPSGQTLCGGACVDAQSSTTHCGMCGNACPTGQSCSMGRCACPSGQTLCGGACVDTDTSGTNCGACGTACPAGQLCNGGSCSLLCTEGRTRCGSGTAMTCADTQSDSANCGACGTACPAGSVCQAGRCGCDVTPGGRRELCGTGASAMCTNIDTDPLNCGACGTSCGAGRECRMGVCGCTGGQLLCGAGASAACIDGSSDENNCGACGARCTGGANTQLSICAGSTCRDICDTGFANCDNNRATGCEINTNTDDLNCGACGTRCTIPGQACRGAGACVCLPGMNVCGAGVAAACTNRLTDRNNCGTCGTVCPNAQTCQSGSCACPVAGQILCNGVCVDPQTDNNHCNGCNMACTGGTAPNVRSCRGGMCLCAPGRNYCGGQCSNPQSDPLNCNGCGTICPGNPGGTAAPGGTQSCVNAMCSLVCAANRTRCGTGAGQYCADIVNDVNNCNGCGLTCTGGKVCGGAMGCVCPAGETDCGGTCRNLQTDPLHCGTCPNICPGQPGGPSTTGGTQLCSGGMCGLTCASPTSTCGTGAGMFCTNLATDDNHCGTCATACMGGKHCAGSNCSCTGTGEMECTGACFDTRSDDLHCGSCTTVCPGRGGTAVPAGGAQTCVASSCTLLCGGSLMRCGTGTNQVCANLTSDRANCGACGNACPGTETCSGSSCGCFGAGETSCGGTCRTLATDTNNCGACGNACPSGTACSGGACVCTASTPATTLCAPCGGATPCSAANVCRNVNGTDNSNCGGCGVACTGTGRACAGGMCVCSNGAQTYCAGANACFNLQTDTAHCGSCTNACPAGNTCVSGSCRAPYPAMLSVTPAGVAGNGESVYGFFGFSNEVAVSTNGRYVAFSSIASNLVTGDTNGTWDIFVRDTTMNTTTRVSVDSAGAQGDGESRYGMAISGDGRYVAFSSIASNLVTGDTNGNSDVFVRDTVGNTTTRVSVSSAGAQSNGVSIYGVAISGDGRYVAFSSSASNLVTGDTNGSSDVFVRDTAGNTTTRVSVDSAGAQSNGVSIYGVAISGDGRYVAFNSSASNLVTGDTNGNSDVFVRDTVGNTTTRVSVDSAGAQSNGEALYGVAMSGNGRYVAFVSIATNLVVGDTNGFRDVFVRDTVGNTTTRASVSSAGAQGTSNESAYGVSISEDGRYVAFNSGVANLVTGDTNANWDAFVRDTVGNTTTRVSVSSTGVQANGPSYYGTALSGDGRYLAFRSAATNLVTTTDSNSTWDLFYTYAHP